MTFSFMQMTILLRPDGQSVSVFSGLDNIVKKKLILLLQMIGQQGK